MNKVFSLLLQEERQREISSSVGYFNHNIAALASKAISNTPSQFSKPPMRKDRPICTHCGIPGHIVEKCYKLHGYPPSFKFTRTRTPQQAVHSANQVQELEHPSSFTPPFSITQEQCQKLLSLINPSAPASDTASAHQVCVSPANQDHLFSKMTGNHFVNSVEFLNIKHFVFYSSHALKAASENFQHSSWIIDTGATDHMVNSISYFTTISVVESRYVKLPNGQLALITHIGTVRISQELTLHDVLCVPSFSFNLISVSKLIQTLHCCLIFLGSYCFMQNLSPWKTIGVGEERSGLYHLLQVSGKHSPIVSNSVVSFFNNISNSAVSATSIKNVSDDIWHYRLGHVSSSRMHLLHQYIPAMVVNKNNVCTICPLAKQRKLSFDVSQSHTNFLFDLIHCDIWGPFSVKSTTGCSYFLTIVDDHSRFTWVYLMNHKSQTRDLIKFFFSTC
jgi:hypothetical protein